MGWATVEQVADHLGVPVDDRVARSLDVAQAWCSRKRRDLSFADPVDAAVSEAVVRYAALVYRERATPQGFAGDPSFASADDQNAWYRIRELLGVNRPVAR